MREMNCQPGRNGNVTLPSAARERRALARRESASQLDRVRHLKRPDVLARHCPTKPRAKRVAATSIARFWLRANDFREFAVTVMNVTRQA
jgi:hypothetical protein